MNLSTNHSTRQCDYSATLCWIYSSEAKKVYLEENIIFYYRSCTTFSLTETQEEAGQTVSVQSTVGWTGIQVHKCMGLMSLYSLFFGWIRKGIWNPLSFLSLLDVSVWKYLILCWILISTESRESSFYTDRISTGHEGRESDMLWYCQTWPCENVFLYSRGP